MNYFNTFTDLKFYSSSDPKINYSGVTVTNGFNSSPYLIHASGFSKDDITAEIKSGELHITGESDKYGKRSINTSLFIPDNIDQNSIEVSVADGMISITFENKREESKKIKVK